MRRKIGILWFYLIALVAFATDQIAKKWIERTLNPGDRVEVLGDFFVLTLIRNSGAAFGILQRQTVFFLTITVIVVAGIVWYLHRSYRSSGFMLPTGLALILGGAVGNFVDRALYGEVVDFLQFTFGKYVFPIFNLADTAIVTGVGLVLLDALLAMRRESGEEQVHGETGREDGPDREERPQLDG